MAPRSRRGSPRNASWTSTPRLGIGLRPRELAGERGAVGPSPAPRRKVGTEPLLELGQRQAQSRHGRRGGALELSAAGRAARAQGLGRPAIQRRGGEALQAL